jgi:hypothetical protein
VFASSFGFYSQKSERILAIALAVYWLTVAERALALPEYRVAAGTSAGYEPPSVSNTAQSVSASYSFSEPALAINMRSGDAFAVAGPGKLGAYSHATIHYPLWEVTATYTNLAAVAWAEASLRLDDLIITLESDPTFVGSVQGTFSVELSGTRSTNAVAINGGYSYAEANSRLEFAASVNFPDIVSPGVFEPDPGLNAPNPDQNPYLLWGAHEMRTYSLPPSATGRQNQVLWARGRLADGFDGHQVFSSAPVTLPVGMPFQMNLTMFVSATTQINLCNCDSNDLPGHFRYAESATDFSHSMSFPLNADVFGLPTGYTVNSPSAGIVNNRFVIPEPTSLGLLVAGTLALFCRRRQPSFRYGLRLFSVVHLVVRGSPERKRCQEPKIAGASAWCRSRRLIGHLPARLGGQKSNKIARPP